jgi:hypothetical protein
LPFPASLGDNEVLLSRRENLIALAALLTGPGKQPKSAVAFHYAAIFSPEEVRWYKRFSILVTGAILSPQQSEVLAKGGGKLISYHWSSAFYPGDASSISPPWEETVLRNRTSWLLNSSPSGGGAEEEGRAALWYDFGNPVFIAENSGHLAALLTKCGYDGYFFDTLGFSHLPEPLQREFRQRHPELDYDRCQGAFLKQLRDRIPAKKLIFLNQGYRNPDVFLPYADLDLTESYFTAVQQDGSTVFRKWRGERRWESISVPMAELVTPASVKYPKVSFVHLNYAAGNRAEVRRAIRYSYAAARLWDHRSYVVVAKQASAERDEIYFADLGNPVSPTYQEHAPTGVAWRVFEKAVVAINSGPGAARIPGLNLDLPDPPQGFVFLKSGKN